MTCIVGLEHDGKVIIGGDSRGTGGVIFTSRIDEKVFTNGKFLFGITSSFRMGQLLRYKFTPPTQAKKDTDMAYLVGPFMDAVRKCFRTNGFSYDDEGDNGGTFLVGYKGLLYKICSDYQVGRPRLGFDACGCGNELALGAMYALRKIKMTPELRVRRALESAAKFSAGCGAPFTILEYK